MSAGRNYCHLSPQGARKSRRCRQGARPRGSAPPGRKASGPELLSPIPTGGTKATPMQTGGKTTSIGAPRPTTPNPYIPGGSLGNAGSWMVPPGGGSPSRTPYIPGGSLNPRPIPIGTKTQPFMPAVRPDIPNFRRLQPRPGLEAPQTRPAGAGHPVPTPLGGG